MVSSGRSEAGRGGQGGPWRGGWGETGAIDIEHQIIFLPEMIFFTDQQD